MEPKFVVQRRKPSQSRTVVVSTRLPDRTILQLDDIAQQTGRTRNELIFMCIEYALSNLEILPPK